MMAVSILGGLMCRYFLPINDRGYIHNTAKTDVFKVNYTRKLQHFAAYLVPLLLHTRAAPDQRGAAWVMLILRAIVPSIPSTKRARASHPNIAAGSFSATATKARKPQSTPLAVKKCTAMASARRCRLTGTDNNWG